MSEFVKAHQNDVAEFERVFGGIIAEVESSLAVRFKNASGQIGFQNIVANNVPARHFSPSFLDGLREAKIVSPQPTPT